MADFAVAPNAAALAPGLTEYFSVDGDIAKGAMPTNSEACAALTVSTLIYKKAAGQSSFVKVGGSVQKGIWHATGDATIGFIDGTCTLANKSGAAVVGTPNKAGQDIYRTAVQTNAAGLATGVRGSIVFVAPGPS